MSRGKQLKTKMREAVTEAAIVAEAVRLANKQAEDKYDAKQSIPDKIMTYFKKQLEKTDVFECVSILGVTIILKQGIEFTEDLATNPATFDIIKIIASFGSMGFSNLLLPPSPTPEDLARLKLAVDSPYCRFCACLRVHIFRANITIAT